MSVFLFLYAVGTRQIPSSYQRRALPLLVLSTTWFLCTTHLSLIKIIYHECLRLESFRA